jgi:hypothetical protein
LAVAVGQAQTGPIRADSARSTRRTYLYGPWSDFVLLGGASFLLLPIVLLLPEAGLHGPIAFAMFALANVINNPHFAHSYQIFYRQFAVRLMDPALSTAMRARYLFAGVAVPLLLAGYLALGVARQDVAWVGAAGNIMALFVGWHYVKQGYGMLMVDAALKRNFFSESEKKALLVNGYAVWTAAWLSGNSSLARSTVWDINYYNFGIPTGVAIAAGAIAAVTATVLMVKLLQRLHRGQGLPANGVLAYLATLYLWVLFVAIDPIWVVVVPALHSIQYLAVVYRFQSNLERDRAATQGMAAKSGLLDLVRSSAAVKMTLFILTGMAIGVALFWSIPGWLDSTVPYDRQIFGANLFLFCFWIFINVHHYFIDSVIWRRGNPEATRFLFEA